MVLPSIKNIKVKGARVVLRVDFNVLSASGEIEDTYRIERVLPTLRFLKKGGAKIIIVSHLSANRGISLRPVAEYFNKNVKELGLRFVPDKDWVAIKTQTRRLDDGDVVMLENLRVHEGEEANSAVFAKELAGLGDLFVNDAFSASHRYHASIVGLPSLLPSFVGLLFEDEVSSLLSVFKPDHPFLLILGGVKLSSKLSVLDRFLNIADNVFIGGFLANCFLSAAGVDVGGSFCDKTASVDRYLKEKKIILPEDVKKKDNKIYDIGNLSSQKLDSLVKDAKFILWNGPLGNIDEIGFSQGTERLAMSMAVSKAKTIIGGGDTVSVLDNLGLLDKFSFVSTAGGAMLKFLATGTLPGIEAIKASV